MFSKGTVTTVSDPLAMTHRSCNKPRALFIVTPTATHIKKKSIKEISGHKHHKSRGLEIRGSPPEITKSELRVAICVATFLFSTDFDKEGGGVYYHDFGKF